MPTKGCSQHGPGHQKDVISQHGPGHQKDEVSHPENVTGPRQQVCDSQQHLVTWEKSKPASLLDDMSSRIDDLEKNIADLMTQAGVEEVEGENKIPATQKS
ncbi:hypothetical protein CB1_000711023 [Camelus ferus]|nr:hypothetical protein CB1_000711023 [Camelus ferus]